MKKIKIILSGVFFFCASNYCMSQTPITDANIHSAVDLWISDQPTAEVTYGHISGWDVSNVTNMSYLFYPEIESTFNDDISNWDVSNVTDMSSMFQEAVLFNQPIGNWDVSNVTDMSGMFFGGDLGVDPVFNQPIGNWDVSNVTDMSYMFSANDGRGPTFNQPIGNWDVSNVSNMEGMFYENQSFNQPIANWDVSNVTNMTDMFSDASYSTSNYDNLLIGWANLTLQPNVYLEIDATFCNGGSAKAFIENNFNWTIADDGLGCDFGTNCLKVTDADAFLGVSKNIVVNLENDEIIKGFQFDITFPNGFVFETLNLTSSDALEEFQVSSSNVGGNTFRVIGFSFSNATIASDNAPVLTFPTFINESTPLGDYSIPITNVTLSDINNYDITSLCATDGIISVFDYPLGDSNGDSSVNVLDILGTIDYIFENPPSTFYFDLADVNFDDSINVLDVLGIQDIILGPASIPSKQGVFAKTTDNLLAENYLVISDNEFTPGATDEIEIELNNDDVVKGLQFDFVLPEGFTFDKDDIMPSSRLNGFTVTAQEIGANTFRVVIFSFSSATVGSGTGAILNLPLYIETDATVGNYPINFDNVIISDTGNTDVATTAATVGEISINTLGIENFETSKNNLVLFPNPVMDNLIITSEVIGEYLIYDVNGRTVANGTIVLGKNEVYTSSFPGGLYFVNIKNDKGVQEIRKFIKR